MPRVAVLLDTSQDKLIVDQCKWLSDLFHFSSIVAFSNLYRKLSLCSASMYARPEPGITQCMLLI